MIEEESTKEKFILFSEFLRSLELWQQSTIGYFLHLFKKLSENESVTKMSHHNIAKVFGPTLFCAMPIDIANVLMHFLIQKSSLLYEEIKE